MSLREEVELYSKLTGRDGTQEPIVRIGAFLDGYEKGKEDAEPHWIPCSERLPENNDPVNVTWVNRKPVFYYSEIKDKPYTATAIYFRGRWFWYSCVIEDWLAEYGSNESFLANLQEAVDGDIEITAWMPLPEPMRMEKQ